MNKIQTKGLWKYISIIQSNTNPSEDKVCVHGAEGWSERNEEDNPDDHDPNLVQHCAGRGRQLLGHSDT